MIITYIVRVLIFIILLIFLYFMFDIVREINRRGYISSLFGNVQGQYEKRKKQREVTLLLEGDKDDKKLIEKMDYLIESSRINQTFPLLTSEIFMAVTIIFSLITAVIVQILTKVSIFSIAAFFLIIMIVILILRALSKSTYDKIDDQVLIYLNTLENLAASNSDIVEIIEKSLEYTKEPLRSYNEEFVFQCKKGIPITTAFKNYQDKIESRRLKQVLKNLEICSKYEANYREILNKSRVIMKNYFLEKERRKKEVREGRFAIISVVVIGIILFNLVGSFNEDLYFYLKNTTAGNIILGYNIAVLLFAIYKFITIDKINY